MLFELDEEIEVLDPLDSVTVDVTFTARELYTILDTLYFDTNNPPNDVLDLVKYLGDRLLDNDLPVDRQSFDSEYLHNHEENEQYKRIIFSTEETP
jgi:hypothetical protein